jgi:hypothetical protein
MTTESLIINASNNDADQCAAGSAFKTGENTIVVASGTHEWRKVSGLRFTGVDVPTDVHINSAYLTVKCRSGYLNIRWRIHYEPASAAKVQPFKNAYGYDVVTRDKSSLYKDWTATADPGTKEATVDIKNLVQEIVEQSGWMGDEGNGIITLLCWGQPTPVWPDHIKTKFVAYDDSATTCARLVINYTPHG